MLPLAGSYRIIAFNIAGPVRDTFYHQEPFPFSANELPNLVVRYIVWMSKVLWNHTFVISFYTLGVGSRFKVHAALSLISFFEDM